MNEIEQQWRFIKSSKINRPQESWYQAAVDSYLFLNPRRYELYSFIGFNLASVPPPLRCDCSDSGKEKRETVTLMPATVPSRHLQTPAQGGFKNDYMKHLKQASKRSSFKHGRCVTVHGGFKKHIQNYKMIVEGLSANMSSQFYVILEVFKVSPTFIMLYKTLCIKLDDIIWKPPDASARNRATKSKSKRR
ncbi:hypothetical protein F2Q68_00023122 [Brassica cretica]|uniref:Uncharacterized protein n=2 Tax=Brassica cretica TaxID=69181 RepID=A0A8S9FS58_BRACR|nr:hypothetical protein F2Q68_00023122 [Brassica cretica]KAF3564881.1 hypothetical protein DY000_02019539 [Brassica cretica]